MVEPWEFGIRWLFALLNKTDDFVVNGVRLWVLRAKRNVSLFSGGRRRRGRRRRWWRRRRWKRWRRRRRRRVVVVFSAKRWRRVVVIRADRRRTHIVLAQLFVSVLFFNSGRRKRKWREIKVQLLVLLLAIRKRRQNSIRLRDWLNARLSLRRPRWFDRVFRKNSEYLVVVNFRLGT